MKAHDVAKPQPCPACLHPGPHYLREVMEDAYAMTCVSCLWKFFILRESGDTLDAPTKIGSMVRWAGHDLTPAEARRLAGALLVFADLAEETP